MEATEIIGLVAAVIGVVVTVVVLVLARRGVQSLSDIRDALRGSRQGAHQGGDEARRD